MTHSRSDDRRHQAEIFCHRYVGFWLVICLVGFCFLGWPMLMAWPLILWGMWNFLNAFFGERSTNASGTHCQHKRRS